MIDATILIPTFRHAALLPYAVRSALAQEGAEIELFVVGDGVEDDTRTALQPFLDDPRVRFFDLPKGERHGERLRHQALQEATGRIVCYLCDDDLLLPDHVAEMGRLLEEADFAHSAPVRVEADGSLRYLPIDLGRPEFVDSILDGWNAIGLTGAAHTLAAYRRLPYGWRTTPRGVYTDLYMWQQFCSLPGFRGVTGKRVTAIHFPSGPRRGVGDAERLAELEAWHARSLEPGLGAELDRLAAQAAIRAAQDFRLLMLDVRRELDAVYATRWWRARRRVARLRLVRALRARRRGAR